MRMVHFIGNILTSHTVAAAHPESGSSHFHITPAEAAALDATGLPVHLEHADNVKVGDVVRSWDDADGSKWVLADVDPSTIEGKFVKNDLSSATPIYTGLSLQHMYRKFEDGRSTKTGIEVSICKDPRRPGCGIVHASSTNDDRYKVCASSRRMSTTIDDTAKDPAAQVTEVAVVAEAAVEASVPSTTQLMQEVVEASRANSDLQLQLDARTAELAQVNERASTEQALAMKKQTQLVQELGDAVLEHVAKLDPTLAGEDTDMAIATLRAKYPKEVARVLQIACCASNHAKTLEVQLAKQKDDMDRKLMEQQYHAAVSNRPGCYGSASALGTVEVVPVQASKRARAESNNPFSVQQSAPAAMYDQTGSMQHIQEAYKSLRGRGSITDAMRDVAGIIGQQREKGFR